MRKALLASLLVLAACPKSVEVVAPPPPPPPLPKVPPGCEGSVGGLYHHQEDATFRFEIHDEGAAVHVRAFRQFGKTREEIKSSAAEIELRRTSEGFRGESHAMQEVIPGTLSCPVTFPYEVTACSPTSLTLRGLPAIDVRVDRLPEPDGGVRFACGTEPGPATFTENILLRDLEASADGGPLDAGALDAGSPVATDAGAATTTDAGAAAPVDSGAPGSPDAGPSATPDGGPGLDAGAAAPPMADGGIGDGGLIPV